MKKFLGFLVPVLLAIVLFAGSKMEVKANATQEHCICGSDECSGTGHDKTQEWQPWDGTKDLPTSGYHYLTQDVTVENSISIEDDCGICLNGHVLSVKNSITVSETAKFTITDCQTSEKHYYKYHKDTAWEGGGSSDGAILWSEVDETTAENASIEVDGGIFVFGSSYIKTENSSVLNMNNVNIVGAYFNNLYTIDLYAQSKLNMSGCNILGCCVSKTGTHLVYLYSNSDKGSRSTANISNCTFQNNVVESGGDAFSFIHYNCADGLILDECVFKQNKGDRNDINIISFNGCGGTCVLNNITIENNGARGICMPDAGKNDGETIVIFKGKCIVRDNIRAGNPSNFYCSNPAVVDSEGLADGSEIHITLFDSDTVPIIAATASSDQTSFFKADDLCYCVKEDESHKVIVTSRIVTQPSAKNSYTITVKTDDLPSGTTVSYQWFEQVKKTSNFKDLDTKYYSFGVGQLLSGTNNIASVNEDMDYIFVGPGQDESVFKKGTVFTFSSSSILSADFGSDTQGSLSKAYNETTGKYDYSFTSTKQGFAVSSDAAFTIEDVKVNTFSYSPVTGETTKTLKNGTNEKIYRCEVTIGSKTLYSDTVKFEKEAKYTVRHYQQNVADAGYTLKDTDESTGKPAELTKAEAKKYDGFTAQTFNQETIKSDDSTNVNIYYDRNIYDIAFVSGGQTVDTQKAKYGALLDEPADPKKQDYTFDGWYKEDTFINKWDFSKDIITKDIILSAKWIKKGVKVSTGDTGAAVGDETLQRILESYTGNATKVEVRMNVTQDTVDETEKALIEAASKGKKFVFYDVDLILVEEDNEQDYGDENSQLIAVTYKFNFDGKENIQVFRVHNAAVTELTETPNVDDEKVVYNKEAGTITIIAKKYSTYAFAYNETSPTPPPTGDTSKIWLFGLLAFVALAAVVVLRVKKENK